MRYLVNQSADTCLTSASGYKTVLDTALFKRALYDVDFVIKKIMDDIPVDIFSILGMRNLSAFVGELFARSIAKEANGLFISNPHQDGYPDLLLMDALGRTLGSDAKCSDRIYLKSGKVRIDKTKNSSKMVDEFLRKS